MEEARERLQLKESSSRNRRQNRSHTSDRCLQRSYTDRSLPPAGPPAASLRSGAPDGYLTPFLDASRVSTLLAARKLSSVAGRQRSPVTTERDRRPNIPNPRASEGWTAASHASASNSARTESSITASRKIVTTIPLNYLPALVTPKLSPTGVTWKWVTLPN